MKKGEKGEGDVNSMRFIKNINKRLIILISMVCLLCMLCGCNVSDILSGPKYSINDCIKKQNKNYDEIYELTCTSEEGYALISGDWDLIEKLVNLKKIQLIGIEKEDDAQQIFSELTKLKKLETVEIVDSKIGKISKLGEIENLKTLSIIGNSGGGIIHKFETITEPDPTFNYDGANVSNNQVTLPVNGSWNFDFTNLPLVGSDDDHVYTYSYYLEEVSSESPEGTTLVYKDKDAKDTLYDYAQTINAEITKKRQEFGLPVLKEE